MLATLPARAAAGNGSLQPRQPHQVVGAAGRQLRRVGLANVGERWQLAGRQQAQQSKMQRSGAWRQPIAVQRSCAASHAACAGDGIATAMCAAVGCLLSAAARQSRSLACSTSGRRCRVQPGSSAGARQHTAAAAAARRLPMPCRSRPGRQRANGSPAWLNALRLPPPVPPRSCTASWCAALSPTSTRSCSSGCS